MFHWVTMMFSQTLGTALGDWTADTVGLGYLGGMALFGALLAALVAARYWTRVSRTALFWAAFIPTRPLGDFLDKPLHAGGLAMNRFSASAALMSLMVAYILFFPQKAGVRAGH